jgi:hypothetical protein
MVQMYGAPAPPPLSDSVRSQSPAKSFLEASNVSFGKTIGRSMGITAGGKFEQLVYRLETCGVI